MIAIVGMACRFPGASDLASYWDLLDSGREGLTRFDDAELAANGVPAALRRNPNYVPVGGTIDGYDEFDPAAFGLGDAEAALFDPQLRVLLECCRHACDDAGHGSGAGLGAVGVFTGAAHSRYLEDNLADYRAAADHDPLGHLQATMGTLTDYFPQQIAYRLDFTGPAAAVQATCSSSLVAVHLAAQSLLLGECDAALAGGVSLIVPQGRGYLHVPDSIFAADGHTRTFGAEASGMVHSPGAGVVVLRRLTDAQADGDPIYAVLRGSAVNNDGATKPGFAAPSIAGQASVITEALAAADVEPSVVDLIEAHGTATAVGDQIELAALAAVFGTREGADPIALGSVKSNIGHTNTAAGIASLIKTVLAIHHRRIPATLHADPIHPDLAQHGDLFDIVHRTRPWHDDARARIAGVSAFGIGGTNCHVIVGQGPGSEPGGVPDERAQLLLASGTDEVACQARLADVTAAAEPQTSADLAYTLACGTHPNSGYRAARVLAGDTDRDRAVAPHPVSAQPPRVVFVFPGAGAQYAGMGAGLYRDEPVFAAAFDECADAMQPILRTDIREFLTPGRAHSFADDPRYSQPLLFAVSLAAAETLRAYGIEPDAVLGHSLGEYTAAVVAGMFSAADAARTVAIRSQAVADVAAGGMLAVSLSTEAVTAVLPRYPALALAAINAADECVVSGPAADLDRVAAELAEAGVRTTRLHIDLALHSAAVAAAEPTVREAASAMQASPATLSIFSTLTGQRLSSTDPEHWVRHLREPVRFADALDAAVGPEPTTVVQVGPGGALAALARRRAPVGLHSAIGTFPDADETAVVEKAPDRADLLMAAGQLWCTGVDLDVTAMHRGRGRVRLPGYPFQRRRLWIDPPADRPGPDLDPATDLQIPTWRALPPLVRTGKALRGTRWLVIGATETSTAPAALVDAGAEIVSLGRDGSADRVDGVLLCLELETVDTTNDQVDGAPVQRQGNDNEITNQLSRALQRAGTTIRAVSDESGTPPAVLIVSRAAQPAPDAEPATDPAATASTALGRVVADETRTRCRSVDLPADYTPADLAALAAEAVELLGADSAVPYHEIAPRNGVRWSRDWYRWTPAVTEAVPLRTVVILGGFGRLGRLLAEHFTAHGAHVALAGRAVAGTVEIGTPPGTIGTHRVDVTDHQAIRTLLAEIGSARGGIDVVVHAAGAVGPDAIAGLTEYRTGSEPVPNIAAKAAGTVALAQAISASDDAAKPRVVLLMSSVAATIGGFGLAEYAVANRFLDAWADRSRGEHAPHWLSVAWDTWAGDERTDAAALTATRDFALHPTDGLTAIDRLLALANTVQLPSPLAVSPRALAASATRSPAAGRLASTRTHSASAVSANDSTLTGTERDVARLWSELLGERVTDPDADFFALGGHSVLATRMLERLRADGRGEVRLRELIARPTVSALAELIAKLPEPSDSVPVPQHTAPVDEPFPLTRVQHAYWIGRSGAFGLGDVACHFYLEYDCENLDLDRYEQAWNRAIRRHGMLRTIITDDGRNRVLDQVPDYRVRRHDLTVVDPDERPHRLADLRRQLSHRVHRPDRWPLFDVRAARIDDTTVRLFVGIDALICDSASFFLLDRDLRHFYYDPDAELPTPRTSFADYVAYTAHRRDTGSADYWRERMHRLPDPPALPTRTKTQARPWFARRRDQLSRTELSGLRALAAKHEVTLSAVLLTAYADALAAWSGDERFAVMLTLVDRPIALPDIDQVVGDFTALIPHEVDRCGGGCFAIRVERTKERLFDDLDHRDHSALDLMADLATSTGRRLLLPVVFTSALDVAELVGGDTDLEWVGHVVHGVSQTPQVWLDHQVFVQDGTLQLQWDVLETVLDPTAADDAFAGYVEWVRRLATDAAAWIDAGDGDGPSSLANPGNDVVATVAAIWAQILSVAAETIAPDATFVGAGGDSVLAVRMAAMVRTQLGVTVPVTDLVGEMTLAQLAAHILDRRTIATTSAPPTTELVRRTDHDEPFALTPLQQAYWVGQHDGWALSYSSAHMYVDFLLGGLERTTDDGVGAAVRRLVDRQPMLRAVFSPDGTQRVLGTSDPRLAALPVTTIDLRSATIGNIDETVVATRTELQRTGPTMDPWPFCVTAILLPGNDIRLHIVASLLIADGWSFQLMFTELFTYLDEPNAVLPPLTAEFGDYVETVRKQRSEPQWQAQRDWWWQQLDSLPTAPALPLAAPVDQVRPAAMVRRETRLSGERMAVLRARCAEYGITPSTVFATCYSIALARLAGHRRFLLNVLYLNRLHLPADLDHAVGPYAGTVLLDVELPADPAFTDAARQVQDAMGRTLDHGQVTGVEVVRELARRRRDSTPQAPVVFHSTLGLHPPTATPEAIAVRDFFQRVRTPQVALDLQVFEWDWDEETVVNLDAVAELFAPGVLDELFADIRDQLTALIERPTAWSAPLALPEHAQLTRSAPEPVADTTGGGPPRTPAERIVGELWRELLGLESLDPDGNDVTELDRATDFFELGGDSVLAIRMLGRLRGRFSATVAPRDFLRDPTIAATAAAISSRAPAEDTDGSDADCAVTLRGGAGSPLFLIHPTGGDISCYLDLAGKLDTARPVIGIQDPELAGLPGPEGIDTMAGRYEAILRTRQPRGPYLIGGWSMGGIIAHELARRLRSTGDEVALLAMIDANVADRIRDADGAEFWARYLGSLEAFLDIDLGSTALDDGFDLLAEPDRRTVVAARLAEAGLLRDPDPAELRSREAVFRRHLSALGNHCTATLHTSGAIELIRATRVAPRNSGVGMGVDDCTDLPDLGWSAHTNGDLSTHTVAAHHYALLRAPDVDTVAHLISQALARVPNRSADD